MYVRRYNQIVTYIVLEKLKEDDSSKQKRFKLTLTITQLNLWSLILLFILYGILWGLFILYVYILNGDNDCDVGMNLTIGRKFILYTISRIILDVCFLRLSDDII